jgi:hypothetical protein
LDIPLQWFTIAYMIISFGRMSAPVLRDAAKFGDLSYGLYLWAFPIQQLVLDHTTSFPIAWCTLGGFKRSSQHSLCWPIEAIGQAPLQAFSKQVSFEAATAAIASALCMLRSVPFGKYWRSSPLVFSLVPRCHGL